MKLVICEKPSVGAAVAAALGVREKKDGYIEGNGYVISWCIGHLVGLAEAAAYGEQYRKWSYDSLPILPQEWQYTVAADKGKQFKILKDLMQRSDVSEVVNACDAGREGELIFRFVYHQAGCKKPFTRLWISSMETDAIKSGFDNLKDGRRYDALYHSALLWGDRIFEKCGIRRDEEGDGGKTLEIRGKRRLSARDGGANYQQS